MNHKCIGKPDSTTLFSASDGKGWYQAIEINDAESDTDITVCAPAKYCPYCGQKLGADPERPNGRYMPFGTDLVLGTKSNGNSLIYGGDYPVPFRTDWLGVPRLNEEEPGKRYAVLLEELPEWAERG